MDWKRVKSILIALLLVTNLLLGLNIYNQYIQLRRIEEDGVRLALRLMGGDAWGITEEMALALPATMNSYRVERDLEGEKRFAVNLLGQQVTEENRGGGVYEYTSPEGHVFFRNSMRLEIRLSCPAEDFDSCMSRLQAAGLDIKNSRRQAEGDSLFVFQQVEGLPVENCSLQLTRKDGQLVAQGQWAFSGQWQRTPIAHTRGELLLALNRAMEARQDLPGERVLSLSPGYLANTAGGVLQPVWLAETTFGAFALNTEDQTAQERPATGRP